MDRDGRAQRALDVIAVRDGRAEHTHVTRKLLQYFAEWLRPHQS